MPRKKIPDLAPYPHPVMYPNTYTIVADTVGTYNIPVSGIEVSYNEVINDGSNNFRRSLRDRLSDVINVKDFGAKGDGDQDDTYFIQLAANNAEGRSLFFPEGTYRLLNSVKILPNTTVFGFKSVLKQESNNTSIFVHNITEFDNPSKVKFQGIHFIGKGPTDLTNLNVQYEGSVENLAKSYGIVSNNTVEIVIDGCIFESFRNGGIYIENSTRTVVVNNIITGTVGQQGENDFTFDNKNRQFISQRGIHLYSTRDEVNTWSQESYIVNNKISRVSIGIKVNGGYKNTTIKDNNISDVTTDGIRVDPDDQLSIIGNNINNAYVCGINLNSIENFGVVIPDNISIKDNNIHTNGTYSSDGEDNLFRYSCIRINIDRNITYGTRYGKNVVVSNNNLQADGNDTNGIVVFRCFNTSINDNKINNIGGSGIILSYGYGEVCRNILTNVADTNILVDTYPLKTTFIKDNLILDSNKTLESSGSYSDKNQSARKASWGYIDVYSGFFSTIKLNGITRMPTPLWQLSKGYPEDSIVVTRDSYNNLQAYRAVKSGTSSNLGAGPQDARYTKTVNGAIVPVIITDERAGDEGNGVKWSYIGPFNQINKGKAVLIGNVISITQSKTPTFSLYTDADLEFEWENNRLPIHKRDLNGNLIQPLENLKTHIQGVISSDINNVYGGVILGDAISVIYKDKANGQPGRNFIGEGSPLTGEWMLADKIWNSNPAAAGASFLGWVCVQGGSPGVWQPFGPVDAQARQVILPPVGGDADVDEVVLGNDTRLTDKRTPQPHSLQHRKGGIDPIVPNLIGALDLSKNLLDLDDVAEARFNLGFGTVANYDLPTLPESNTVDVFLGWDFESGRLKWSQGDVGQIKKYTQDFGDSINATFEFIHNFNSQDVIVQVYVHDGGNYNLQQCSVSIVDTNTVSVTLDTIINVNTGRVVIMG
jgi:hypothetical protein